MYEGRKFCNKQLKKSNITKNNSQPRCWYKICATFEDNGLYVYVQRRKELKTMRILTRSG